MFRRSNGLDHSGIILIISGERSLIEDNLDGKFKELLSRSAWANIKELDLHGDNGRIVLKVSSLNDAEDMITKFRQECAVEGLQFNLISDVNVPL